jgi:MFS transporter, CP family, cyanate transporter
VGPLITPHRNKLCRILVQPTDSIGHYLGAASARDYWVKLCLLWLAGVALRLTLLAIPPIIPMIQRDLQLSGTEIGILSGLPAVLFGAAALPGSALIGRFGALSTLIAGVIVTGIASALRGAMLNVWALYAATIMMSAGIAIMQPSLPPLVRQWLPQRVTFATAVFTNGLLVGEVIAVMLTIPLVLPIVNGSWRAALAVWSLPIFLIAAAFIVLAPRSSTPALCVPTSVSRTNWRDKRIWQLGFVFGSVNSVYFCSNAFLPGHLAEAGRPDLIGGALTALNFGQLPASLVLLAISTRFERRALPFVLSGALMLLCLAGIVMTAGAWTIVFATGVGALCAVVLTLGFALPPLLTAPSDVARMSAAMFTISYSEGLFVSVLSGMSWDLMGDARFAFLPIAISTLPLLLVAPGIRFSAALPSAP